MTEKKEMNSKYLVELYEELENVGINIWIDGGWAVDALLEKQTRAHEDLDIAVESKNLNKLREYLEKKGYKNVERDESKMWDLVLNDGKGHELDIHAFSLDDNEEVIEENEWAGFSKDSLSGWGVIDRVKVRCVSLAQIIKTHDQTKRELKDKDHADLNALKKKFKF